MTTVNVGSILTVNVASWENEIPVVRNGTVTQFTSTSITLDSNASQVNNDYASMWIVIMDVNQTFDQNYSQVSAQIISYNGTTKIATIGAWNGTPVAGREWRIIKDFPIQRTWQWYRDEQPITDAIGTAYTVQTSDIGKSITVNETAGFIDSTNDGKTPETPSATHTAASSPVTVIGTANTQLVYQDQFVYRGSFRLPDSTNDYTQYRSFPGYSGGGMFVRGTAGSKKLVVRGHIFTTCVGEISVSGVSLSSTGTYDGLAKASMVTPNNTNDLLPLLSSGLDLSNNGVDVGKGTQYWGISETYDNKIIWSMIGFYGINYRPCWVHYRRPGNLLDQNPANIEGPFMIIDPINQPSARFTTGFYCSIPAAWRSRLGGDTLGFTGGAYTSISNYQAMSNGPAAMVFDTANIDTALTKKHTGTARSGTTNTIQLATSANATNGYYVGCYIVAVTSGTGNHMLGGIPITAYDGATRTATIGNTWTNAIVGNSTTYTVIPFVTGKQLLGYDYTSPIFPNVDNGFRKYFPIWSLATHIQGMCIPEGTNSLLFIGKSGEGLFSYGGTNSVAGGYRLYDPQNGSGITTHAYPYVFKVYAYDLNDLEKVNQGILDYNDIKPYAVWSFTLPTQLTGYGKDSVVGVTYNPDTKQVYLSEEAIGLYGASVIHSFEVTNAVVQ